MAEGRTRSRDRESRKLMLNALRVSTRLGSHGSHTRLLSPLGVHLRSLRTSVNTKTTVSTPTPPQNSPVTWVSRLPQAVQPYMLLMRLDKPIGTMLLYYPCSEPLMRTCRTSEFGHSLVISMDLVLLPNVLLSLGDTNGVLRSTFITYCTFDSACAIWNGRPHHARSRLYDK